MDNKTTHRSLNNVQVPTLAEISSCVVMTSQVPKMLDSDTATRERIIVTPFNSKFKIQNFE